MSELTSVMNCHPSNKVNALNVEMCQIFVIVIVVIIIDVFVVVFDQQLYYFDASTLTRQVEE